MAKKTDIEKLLEDPKARELLKEAGYRLSRNPTDLVAKTFKLPQKVIDDFYDVARSKKIRIQDAIEDAINEWTRNNK